MRPDAKALFISTLLLIFCTGMSMTALAAPKAELWPRWQANDPQSSIRVDHSRWAQFLNKYLLAGKPGATNLVRYAAVTPEDKAALDQYIAELSSVPMTKLNRAEQKAAWINLYNALTVFTILDHYPVKSIREISSGWFSYGPWDLKLLEIEGIELSLNDIEHRILRPIWQDNLVHYAVACASMGCPKLQAEPFTAENSDRLLAEAASDYINSPRGADIRGDSLLLSSIYDWFQADFGNSVTGVIAHLAEYADPALKEKLDSFSGDVDFAYDWKLNEAQNH